MNFFIIGNPENRRVQLFSESLVLLGYDKPIVLSYLDILKDNLLQNTDFSNSILRIESAGENNEVRNLLIAKGMNVILSSNENDISNTNNFSFNKNSTEILYTEQWYLGYSILLDEIQQTVNRFPTCKLMNTPSDIQIMFDKIACQQRLKDNHISIPDFYKDIRNYDTLLNVMKANNLTKVFIKPAHASSASGVIAFRISGNKQQAISTIEIKKDKEMISLHNSLKIKTYTDTTDIKIIIDKILQGKAIVEKWLSKATIEDYYFDLRVLVIKGNARHLVVRKSKNIITNLHLGNKRGALEELENTIGNEKIAEIKLVAEKAAACFSSSLYCGVDVLITPNKNDIKVLEVNAFGDLLPNVLHNGESCYEAEIKAIM